MTRWQIFRSYDSFLTKKKIRKFIRYFLAIHIGDGSGRMEPTGNVVLSAPVDISNAVQVSVKYVRKVNGNPSSSNGTRYHCLVYTTWGYLAVSLTRIHRRSINSNQLLDIRAVCHITFTISYHALSFPLFTIHRANILFLYESILLHTNHVSPK